MKWPGREAAIWQERAERAEGLAQNLRDDLAKERERNDRLVAIIADMKREGFAVAPPVRDPHSDDLPAPVRAAIIQTAGGQRTGLAYQLREFAATALAAGEDVHVVADRIIRGDG